jgi:hypothetical protein
VPPTVSELASVTASVDGERIRMILRGLLEHAGARGSEGTGATVSLDHVGSSVEIAVAGATDGGLRRRHPPDDVDVLPLEDLRAAARAHGGDLLSVPRASGVEFVLRLPVA